MNTLHNIQSLDDARLAMSAIADWREKPDWPQHRKLGKRHGGLARTNLGTTILIWKTTSGWHAEIIERPLEGE